MDFKKEIIPLLDSMGELKEDIINSAIVHIDRAENFFQQAKIMKDDQFYTDVIYRTNQAYEGILKIAYTIFTRGTGEGLEETGYTTLTTYELENYFEENNIFNQRVRLTFLFYRKYFRNPSIHEDGLFFSRDEALIAIFQVSAFIYVLLNQMVESWAKRKVELQMILEEILMKASDDNEKTIEEVTIEKISTFHQIPKDKVIFENNMLQIIGAMKGYLENTVKGVEAVTHYKGEDVMGYQPDIVLNYENETYLFIEVKNEYTKEKQEFGYKQLRDSLFRSDVKSGILYFYSDKRDAEYEVDEKCFRDRKIFTIMPKMERKRA
jgi:hypothetical protein